ncbi:MAG: SLC13 family permease, partial [Novosphingobium sp.]
MMALFLWGRFRYDVTAVIALLAAIAIGVVPAKSAFTGFSDDIVVIVGSALVLSAAVQRSGVIERMLQSLAQRIKKPQRQMLVLSAAVGLSSGFIKNVGALAMLMPGAVQMARKQN